MICIYDLLLSHSFFRPGLSCFKSVLELSGEVQISPLFLFWFWVNSWNCGYTVFYYRFSS
jgi:hypothetical protein